MVSGSTLSLCEVPEAYINRLFSPSLSLSLSQLFVFLFDVLSVAVFVIRDRFVKKEEEKKSRFVLKSLSLCKVFSSLSLSFCLFLRCLLVCRNYLYSCLTY